MPSLRTSWLSLAVALVTCEWGCEWGGSSDATGNLSVPDAHAMVDARRQTDASPPDASPPDAKTPSPDAAVSHTHLLLTEVALAPTGAEFIELTNVATAPLDLTHYYLSDNGNYFKLPAGLPAISQGDFIVQFPAGATIAPGGVITIATGTVAAFTTAYGVPPTYSIADATLIATTTSGTPSLTDAGEIVVLFTWDGTSSLVQDVDMLLAGMPTALNGLVSKSGYAQGPSTYATDLDTLANQAATPASGVSTKRIANESGHERQDGTGNGIFGDDETSEAISVTWDTAFTAPTPGHLPPL